jgi:hypothetical protein
VVGIALGEAEVGDGLGLAEVGAAAIVMAAGLELVELAAPEEVSAAAVVVSGLAQPAAKARRTAIRPTNPLSPRFVFFEEAVDVITVRHIIVT